MAVRNATALLTQIDTLIEDNNNWDITPADVRAVLVDVRDTLFDAATVRGIIDLGDYAVASDATELPPAKVPGAVLDWSN